MFTKLPERRFRRKDSGTIRTIRFDITVSMRINAVALSGLVVLNAALLYDRKFD